MNGKKRMNHYQYLDILRGFLCLGVLLYHLGVLKGGFLAVCSFFTLSGYLSTRSFLKKDRIDLKQYYCSRLKKIYLPLVIVVLISIAAISFVDDLVWVSLKPETTSVLLGYNNFWQIKANLDYFARHVDSPFMHLWYIAILLQFELVFPFLFMAINSTKKISRYAPSVLASLLSIGFTLFFFIFSGKAAIMAVYYHTCSRVFSLLVGVAVCFIHQLIDDGQGNSFGIFHLIYWFVMFCLLALFVFVDSTSNLFALSMIVATLLTGVIIECAVCMRASKNTVLDFLTKPLAKYSYEIYLVQYPIIYLYQCFFMNQNSPLIRVLAITLVTLLVAFVIHSILQLTTKPKTLQIAGLAVIALLSGFGGFQYVIAKDHTKEMEQLQQQLAESAAEMEKKKQEYALKQQQENDAWQKLLDELEPDEDQIKETVKNLPVICVGDSVMLGAVGELADLFPNSYVDAEVSRSGWVINEIIQGLKIAGPVVIHTGTNGDVPEYVKDQMMKACEGYDVFWLTVTNDRDVHVNADLKKFCDKYDNAHLIDWQSLSANHPDWFYADGIHLPTAGRKAYANIIFEAIFEVKLAEFNRIRDDAILQHQQEMKKKITFYGNELITGLYNELIVEYPTSNFVSDKNMNFETLLEQLKKEKEANTLTYRLVFGFDRNNELTLQQMKQLLDECEGHEVTFVTLNQIEPLEGCQVISFKTVLDQNPDYYRPDRIHLTEVGNEKLAQLIKETINPA